MIEKNERPDWRKWFPVSRKIYINSNLEKVLNNLSDEEIIESLMLTFNILYSRNCPNLKITELIRNYTKINRGYTGDT